MTIYYWKLQAPDKLIFSMIRGGNLLLETPDTDKLIFKMIRGVNLLSETPESRQTNFQYDQRGSRCWWHQWFNTLVRRRPLYVLFAFHAWHESSLFHIGNTDIFRTIIAYCKCHFFPNPTLEPFIFKSSCLGKAIIFRHFLSHVKKNFEKVNSNLF